MGQKWLDSFHKLKHKVMAVLQKNYLGIDVSKPWFDVSLLTEVNHVKQPMVTERFENNAAGMKLFKKWLHSCCIVVKALRDHGLLYMIQNH